MLSRRGRVGGGRAGPFFTFPAVFLPNFSECWGGGSCNFNFPANFFSAAFGIQKKIIPTKMPFLYPITSTHWGWIGLLCFCLTAHCAESLLCRFHWNLDLSHLSVSQTCTLKEPTKEISLKNIVSDESGCLEYVFVCQNMRHFRSELKKLSRWPCSWIIPAKP